MEDSKKKAGIIDIADKEILFSKSIKAGKRIYYLDVKRNRKDELFLAITESKKIITGEGNNTSVSFQKHKIFLYQEDFDKFTNGLGEALDFIKKDNEEKSSNIDLPTKEDEGSIVPNVEKINENIKIDIDFEE